jgi:hypothetical protein
VFRTSPSPIPKLPVRLRRFFLMITSADVNTDFWVNGSTIPEVDWDVGPSWSGLLPISGNANETRKVITSPLSSSTVLAKYIPSSSSSGSSLLDPEEISNPSTSGTTVGQGAVAWRVYYRRTV